jgi:hypothetical protein
MVGNEADRQGARRLSQGRVAGIRLAVDNPLSPFDSGSLNPYLSCGRIFLLRASVGARLSFATLWSSPRAGGRHALLIACDRSRRALRLRNLFATATCEAVYRSVGDYCRAGTEMICRLATSDPQAPA